MAGSPYDPDRYDRDRDVRTEAQKEWADWSAHGYRKLYQPRAMLWFGGIFLTVLIVGLFLVFWLGPRPGWP